jgi:hypothetical protein
MLQNILKHQSQQQHIKTLVLSNPNTPGRRNLDRREKSQAILGAKGALDKNLVQRLLLTVDWR